MKGLDGKVALVTGGGSSFGRALALALAARGVRIVVMGRTEKTLGEAVGEIVFGGGKARHVVGDVGSTESLEAAVRKAIEVFGRLDFVIANAAGAPGDAEAVLNTGLAGTHRTFAVALPTLADGGRLVATAGLTSDTCKAAHVATREGLRGLVRELGESLAFRRIRVNAIAKVEGRADARVRAEAEAADFVARLCSTEGDPLTGQTLELR